MIKDYWIESETSLIDVKELLKRGFLVAILISFFRYFSLKIIFLERNVLGFLNIPIPKEYNDEISGV